MRPIDPSSGPKGDCINLLVFTLPGCMYCSALLADFYSVLEGECINDLKVLEVEFGSSDHPATRRVRPRMFPTVILWYEANVRLGWEGFADHLPQEQRLQLVKEAVVLARRSYQDHLRDRNEID